jgi:hypothetical protein
MMSGKGNKPSRRWLIGLPFLMAAVVAGVIAGDPWWQSLGVTGLVAVVCGWSDISSFVRQNKSAIRIGSKDCSGTYKNWSWSARLGLLYAGIAGTAVVSLVYILVDTFKGREFSQDLPLFLLLTPGFIAAEVSALCYLRMSVQAKADAIIVANPLRTFAIRVDLIDGFTPAQAYIGRHCVRVEYHTPYGKATSRKIVALPFEEVAWLTTQIGSA